MIQERTRVREPSPLVAFPLSRGPAVRLGARCLAALYPRRTPHGVQGGKSAEDALAYF